jgi:hypothetical protein
MNIIKQKYDESLWDYVKHFCNAIPYIQDIEIINAFRDGVSDLKTIKEIAMKKPKTVADLLAIADVCIEASEAQAQLLESHGKVASKKKEDREVNTIDRGIVKITATTVSSPRIRRRKGLSSVPMT